MIKHLIKKLLLINLFALFLWFLFFLYTNKEINNLEKDMASQYRLIEYK